jgi:hypothetical protein
VMRVAIAAAGEAATGGATVETGRSRGGRVMVMIPSTK